MTESGVTDRSGPRRIPRNARRLAALVAAAILAFPLSSSADLVPTPRSNPELLEKALREALPGQAERAALMVGPDGPHAAAINSFLLQAIIYGGIVAVVLLVGVIAIIGYGLTKKDKDEERLAPLR